MMHLLLSISIVLTSSCSDSHEFIVFLTLNGEIMGPKVFFYATFVSNRTGRKVTTPNRLS